MTWQPGSERWTPLPADRFVATPPARRFNLSTLLFEAVADWVASTVYAAGDVVKPTTGNGRIFECVVGGTSDSSEPTWDTDLGDDTVDNTVTWRCRGAHVITTAADLSSKIEAGTPLRFKDAGGGWYYARVVAIDADDIAVMGDHLDLLQDISAIEIGHPELVAAMQIDIPDAYGDGAADLVSTDLKSRIAWPLGRAHVVGFQLSHQTDDTGTEPKVNVKVGGAAISPEDASNGVQVGTAVQKNPLTVLDSAAAVIDLDDLIEVACTVAGGTGDAADLTVLLWAVLE